ncbi:hypothetical protein ACOSQ3_011744 [Xanthoceras sorbifolium]
MIATVILDHLRHETVAVCPFKDKNIFHHIPLYIYITNLTHFLSRHTKQRIFSQTLPDCIYMACFLSWN